MSKQNKLEKPCHFTSKKHLLLFNFTSPSSHFLYTQHVFFVLYISSFMFSAIPKQPTTTHPFPIPAPSATPQRIESRGGHLGGRGLGRFRGQGIGPKEAAGRTAVPNKVLEADGGMAVDVSCRRGRRGRRGRRRSYQVHNLHWEEIVGLVCKVYCGNPYQLAHTCQPHSEVSAKQEMLEPCFLSKKTWKSLATIFL